MSRLVQMEKSLFESAILGHSVCFNGRLVLKDKGKECSKTLYFSSRITQPALIEGYGLCLPYGTNQVLSEIMWEYVEEIRDFTQEISKTAEFFPNLFIFKDEAGREMAKITLNPIPFQKPTPSFSFPEERDAYILLLDDGDDIQACVVDKEVWDWIQNSDRGFPKDPSELKEYESSDYWNDRVCPDAIRQKIFEQGESILMASSSDYPVMITSGSWKNDRAIKAPVIMSRYFDSAIEGVQWAEKQGFNLLDKYHGVLY